MLQGKIGYLVRPVASACRSIKRLELQLEGQAACAIDDESPADTAVQATALHGHRPQTGACVLAGGSAARADRLSRAEFLPCCCGKPIKLREDITEYCRGTGM